jgi:hypothetical protein
MCDFGAMWRMNPHRCTAAEQLGPVLAAIEKAENCGFSQQTNIG